MAAAATIGIAAYGMYSSYTAARKQARGAQALAAFNMKSARDDIKMIQIQTWQQQGLVRRDRANAEGSMRTAAAAGGVTMDGSVMSALIANAEERAREENVLRFDFLSKKRQLLQEAELASMTGQMRAQQFKAAGTAALISGAATMVGAADQAGWFGSGGSGKGAGGTPKTSGKAPG